LILISSPGWKVEIYTKENKFFPTFELTTKYHILQYNVVTSILCLKNIVKCMQCSLFEILQKGSERLGALNLHKRFLTMTTSLIFKHRSFSEVLPRRLTNRI